MVMVKTIEGAKSKNEAIIFSGIYFHEKIIALFSTLT